MKKHILLLAINLLSAATFAQLGSGMQYKSGVKKLNFEPVKYEVYGEVVESVRLSENSEANLKKTKVEQLGKLGTQINSVEKELDKVRTKLIEFDYPLRTMADEWISKLQKMEQLEAFKSYASEIKLYKKLYDSKVKEMKANGELEKLMTEKERHGR
jgi:flagellar biosynthesis chaperone FliJ